MKIGECFVDEGFGFVGGYIDIDDGSGYWLGVGGCEVGWVVRGVGGGEWGISGVVVIDRYGLKKV